VNENQRHNMSTRCLLPAVFFPLLHLFYLMEPRREAGFISSKNTEERDPFVSFVIL
jgi:hypothetical protein